MPGIGIQQTHGFSFSFPANKLKSLSCFGGMPIFTKKAQYDFEALCQEMTIEFKMPSCLTGEQMTSPKQLSKQ